MAEDITILQEIDESLRAEKLEQFWHRFGNWVIAACAGIVLATTASVAWKSHQHEAHARATSVLLQAQRLAGEGKYDEAAKLLQSAGTGTSGLAELAKLGRARALVDAGKMDEARAAYKELAEDTKGSDVTLRDFAALQMSILAINQPAVTAPELTEASKPGAPYLRSAQEVQADYFVKTGKNKAADELLTRIAGDDEAPATQRSRAMELLSTLGKDTQ